MNLDDFDTTHNIGLRDIIVRRIEASGPMTFAEFYELAMYHPQHGYYFTHDPTLDFQSSPNVHPIFGACIARQLADFWRCLDRPQRFDVFEAGASSGRLAADVLRYLATAEPDLYAAIRYVLQDVTLAGPNAGHRLEAAGLPADKVEVAAALPDAPVIEGCILSNELLDALPFHRLRDRGGRLYELLAGVSGGRFIDVEAEPGPEVTRHFDALGVAPGAGCDAEISLVAAAWMGRAAKALRRGYLLTLDYGYEATELYAPWRKRGTMLTFYRQTAGEDAFARIGRQDITASVDFTSARLAAEEAGLTSLGSTSQGEFLAALGIGEALSAPPEGDRIEAYYAMRRAVMELTDPAGLGRITALVMGKGTPDLRPAGLHNGL